MKQVIVMRKDLNMRKGKMIVQGSHASEGAYDRSKESFMGIVNISLWKRDHAHTKVCVSVDSEEELLDVHNQAQKAGIISYLVLDAGKTEFKEPTYTCCCLGPDENDVIDTITGKLKLL